MTDTDRVNADLLEMCLRAASPDGEPDQTRMPQAVRALRWFRMEADRGRGIEPGWGGGTIYVRRHSTVPCYAHREIVRLHDAGWTTQAIAERVRRARRTVQNVIHLHEADLARVKS